jgi:hypothetical protein
MAASATNKKPAAKKTAAPKKARTAQKLTITQTKAIESWFDAWAKKGGDLGAKLTDIEARFENKDSFVPQQVEASRAKLVEALTIADEAKAEFAKIGVQYRSFFG